MDKCALVEAGAAASYPNNFHWHHSHQFQTELSATELTIPECSGLLNLVDFS